MYGVHWCFLQCDWMCTFSAGWFFLHVVCSCYWVGSFLYRKMGYVCYFLAFSSCIVSNIRLCVPVYVSFIFWHICIHIGLIELLNWRLQWLVVSWAYKNRTNDRMPASHHGKVRGLLRKDGCLARRNEGRLKRHDGLPRSDGCLSRKKKKWSVGDSPHIMIIVLMRVNHFIYIMYNIYTIYTHCSTDSLLTETLLWLRSVRVRVTL
jgi:hypothetical protein